MRMAMLVAGVAMILGGLFVGYRLTVLRELSATGESTVAQGHAAIRAACGEIYDREDVEHLRRAQDTAMYACSSAIRAALPGMDLGQSNVDNYASTLPPALGGTVLALLVGAALVVAGRPRKA